VPVPDAKTRPVAAGSHSGAFSRLVSIDIRHDYCNHSEGRFGGIAVEPSPVTAERLTRYGLVVRRRSDGIDLFHNEAQARALHKFMRALPDEIRRDPPDDLFGPPLLFIMRLNDPLFFNFTEAPTNVREGRPALLLSNRRIRGIEGQSAEFRLSWGNKHGIAWGARPRDAASMGDDTADSARPAATDAPPASLPAAAWERLAEALAEAEANQAFSGDDILRGWWLESRGEMESATRELEGLRLEARRLPFGLIKIHLIAEGAASSTRDWNGYPIDLHGAAGDPEENEGLIRPARYVLRFPARSTYWRYLIAGRGELDHSSLAVSDPKRPDLFARAGQRELPDGRLASCFEAKTPQPLQQRPRSGLTLTSSLKGANDWQKMKSELPAATADTILPDPHPPPGRCWSDIYVFV
jgi:hypothetical protein